jgi:UPF0755 protein
MTDAPDPRPKPRPQAPEPASNGHGERASDPGERTQPVPELVGARAGGDGRAAAGNGEPVGTGAAPRPNPRPMPAEPIEYIDPDAEWVDIKRRSGPLRRAAIIVTILGLIVGVTGVTVVRWVNNEIHPPGDPGDAVEFTVEPGNTTNDVANNLASEGVIGNSTVFRYWLRRQGGGQTFNAGKYDLAENMDYPDVLDTLRAGPKPSVSINVLIPPGLTLTQMRDRLTDQLKSLDAVEFDQAMGRPELNAPYAPQIGEFPVREGLFFADTYNVDEEAASNEYALLKRMRDQMEQVLNELDADNRAAALGIDRYTVLVIASLIEEEAKIDEDRPRIARVIYNRLDRDMSLGIDATTRYAVGKINGEPLTQSDLNSDSPFNTRKAKGLPPTPIAAPSRASIEAALNPTPDERWLYYVLTNEGGVNGAHTFANTASEFERAKQECIRLELGCG